MKPCATSLISEDRGRLLQVLAVALCAFFVFAGTMGHDLVWDDPFLIQHVQKTLSEEGVAGLFTTSFHVKAAQSAKYYRPVMRASLLVDLLLGGGEPWFSHLLNVLIHSLNAVLVLLLLRRVLHHDLGALFGALVFAVHPVHAEAVAAVYSRMDLLALSLLLPAALLWSRPDELPPTGILPARILTSLSFLLACLTKETAFMLLPVLFLWELLQWRRPGMEKVSHFAFLTSAAFAALIARAAVFAAEKGAGESQGVKAGVLLPDIDPVRILKVLAVNMRLAIDPFPGRTHWFSGDLDISRATLLGALCFLLFLFGAFRLCRKSAAGGLVWWAVFTLPVAGFFHLGQVAAAERYAYMPSVGFCLMVGCVAASLAESMSSRRVWVALAAMGFAALAVGTVIHAGIWKDEVTLYRHVLKSNPSYANIHVNLGVALAREGLYREAIESYAKAEALVPGWSMVAFNRANLYSKLERYEEALEDFDIVLKNDPTDWEATLNKGNVLVALGRAEEAARSYRIAVTNKGSSGKPFVGLGVLAAAEGNHEEAVRYFREAALRDPNLSEAFEGMGGSYIAMGMPSQAEEAFLKAIEFSPQNVKAAVKLGDLLLNTGRPFQAIQAYRTALASEPGFLPAWVGYLRASDAAGLGSEAERSIREMERKDAGLAERIRRATGRSSP